MTYYSNSSRPTLPPLHTLNLPIPTGRATSNSEDSYESKSARNHNRQFSISSSVTASRSPSPFIPDYFATRPSPTPSSVDTPSPSSITDNGAPKVRLVPCSFETADAYIYVPPLTTSTPAAPTVFDDVQDRLRGGRPLLLVGPAAMQLRQPSQKIAKGARVHPYRIMSGSSTSTSGLSRKSLTTLTKHAHEK